ncbi:class I tRNA ligase family protein [Streptomyces collinus]|uniref:class I tRNA ligase family protein n=1 Tax=Streptomyces collinus TaxID=42684 RepID=UPI0036A2F33C
MTAWATNTPPTSNSELHMGAMARAYVEGDVLSRFLRSESRSLLYTSGPDDQQSSMHARGAKAGDEASGENRDSYGPSIVRVSRSLGVPLDQVILPRRGTGHAGEVQRFFRRLYDEGCITALTKRLPYCVACERWLYEAYVVGRCPHCEAYSNGHACEACGRPSDCGDLGDAECALCGQAAEYRLCERLYFPLSPYAERLAAYWGAVRMTPHLRRLCDLMAADGLPDIAITHPADCGVNVPVAGFEDQRISVCFEMAYGYVLKAGQRSGIRAEHSWPVHFFDLDNGYLHAVLFPALYAALGLTDSSANAFQIKEFHGLRRQGFSTDRRHIVWADQVIKSCGSDVLRNHVCSGQFEGWQTSPDLSALEGTHQHLDALWNGWLHGLFDTVEAECGGRVPWDEPAGEDWKALRVKLLSSLAELREAFGPALFAPHRAVTLLDRMVRYVTDFAHVQAYQAQHMGCHAQRRAAYAAQLAVASAMAAWTAPVMPVGAARLAEVLGLPTDRPVTAAALEVPRRGRRLVRLDGPVFGSLPDYASVDGE